MKKLFTKGILIAFGFALASAVFNSNAQEQTGSRSENAGNKKAKVVRRASADLTELIINLKDSRSEGTEYEVFKQLLDERKSFKLLREELLNDIEDFRSEYAPLLQEALLDTLLEKFSEEDWNSWPEAAFILDGEATEARIFVDDISAINSDYGRYLETSAWMFYRLSILSQKGKVFERRKELRRLVNKSDKIFAEKVSPAGSTKDFIKEDILSDAVFLEQIERVRCSATGSYILTEKPSVSAKLRLLEGVNTSYCREDFFNSYEGFLNNLAFEGSFKERKIFLNNETVLDIVSPAFERYPHLQTLHAELFALGAVDSLETGSVGEAENYLEQSLALEEDLTSQELVASYLASEREFASQLDDVDEEEFVDFEDVELAAEETKTQKKKSRRAKKSKPVEEEFYEEEYEEEEGELASDTEKKQPRSMGIWIFIVFLGIIFIVVITAVFFIILNKLKEEQEATDDFSYDSGDLEDFDEEDFWGEEDEEAEDLLDDELSEKQVNDS